MDVLQKIDKLQTQGIRITIDWHSQIENGHAEHVAAGRLPLWTCTATAWKTIECEGIEDVAATISADSISEAFEGIIKLVGEETDQ